MTLPHCGVGDISPSLSAQPPTGYMTLPVERWRSGTASPTLDQIAEEQAVALVYNGISHTVMMATPLDLEDFARGFSLTEGIIGQVSELYDIEIYPQATGIEIQLTISSARMAQLKTLRRNLTGRTGCGLCGVESLQQALRPVQPITAQAPPAAEAVQAALAQLPQHQPLQNLTGALHGAAWCNARGEIQLAREDVGRHNALDKLIGALHLPPTDIAAGFVLVSSRASYEMVQKASRLQIPTLVAVSAPTTLALDYAKAAHINLIGFARCGQHTLYNNALNTLHEATP